MGSTDCFCAENCRLVLWFGKGDAITHTVDNLQKPPVTGKIMAKNLQSELHFKANR